MSKRRLFAEGMTIEKLAWMMDSDEMLDEEGRVVGGWSLDVDGWDGERGREEAWRDDPS